MSKPIVQHPDPDSLLLYLDGELEPRQATRIQEHLSACWQCRTEVEELQKTIGDAVRYRQTVFQSCFPSPPAPWCDIRSRIADADATLGSSSFFSGTLKGIGTVVRNPRWWAPALAAGLALVVVFLQFRDTPAVSASELLRRATIAADSQPRKQRKIQFRTATRRLTRLTGESANSQVALSKTDAESLAVIEAMFASARYNWADPLSAQSYSSWRDRLANKSDEVETADDCFVLKTSTSDGNVVEASLKLRTSDLRPVEGTLEFRNHELLEIKDISEETVHASEATVAANTEARANPSSAQGTIEAPAAAASDRATISDELGVFATLRRLDADLGEPIEVIRRDDKVLVTGIGVAPARQQQLRQELASSRSVLVEFADPGVASTATASERQRVASSRNSPSAAMLQIENYFGSRVAFDQFADQTFELSDALMARVHALRRLAERFPVEIDSKLTADDRRLLVSMRLEHFGALSSKTEGLQQRMGPVLGALGASPTDQLRLQSAQTWQAASEEIFQVARQVEIQLGILLGGAAGETSPAQVLSGLNSLRAKINAYESLLLAAQ